MDWCEKIEVQIKNFCNVFFLHSLPVREDSSVFEMKSVGFLRKKIDLDDQMFTV